ncbi:hypothetical protein BD410DRAFT_784684 [Rickenella mellea]|uniref:Uncharacterized protein n=1 Tax=Rickenella mellea TaxID=50990 RepID=A0A4Y7QDF9_9AGAM|nr:hypothetical protein BD410DRAFT_784684 [Rickenella mellea]
MLLFCSVLALVSAAANSQTQTLQDPAGPAGQSIVEVISVNSINGLPSTSILQTLAAAAPTDPLQQQGPVGQPPPTVAGGVTTYKYTTTDANGDMTVIHDTFTPSFATTGTPAKPTLSGTIMQYSAFLSMVGNNTVPVSNNAITPLKIPSHVWGIAAVVLAGALGGAWTVL